MKIMIRAHDLGVKGEAAVSSALNEKGIDGVQLVVYKCTDDVKYEKGAISKLRAGEIGTAIRSGGKEIPLIGAYFNPVHPNEEKIERGTLVFKDYLDVAEAIGCETVGSETGSYNGDPWIYHPMNYSDEALDRVVTTFGHLADYAAERGRYIGMEGAFGHVCHTPARLKAAVEQIGRDNIKYIFDLYNYLDISNVDRAYEILHEGISLLGDKILLFHIKDFVIENEKLKQCGVGKGILDFDRILSAIYNHNKDAILVLEGTVGDDLPFAVSYLKDKISKIQNDNLV